MQEARDPTTKLPSPSPSPFAAPSPSPYQHHHRYGTFSPPPQQPPVAAAAYHSSPIGWGAQGVVAVPCTVQQQVFVEGLPVREPPLPFCGVGVGWALEKPGLIACTIAGIFALVPFILNGIRMHPFW